MTSAIAATGDQYEISHGTWRAVVTQQGATLRSLSQAGVDLLDGFDANELPQGCRGQQLMPWPNRIRDGHWTFEGGQHQLPLNEPERANAIHGLVTWVTWGLVELAPSQVTQRYLLLPQPGWPGVLELTVSHQLSDDGLRVQVNATNVGDQAVPFGYAAHPYLRLAEGRLDEWSLDLPFDQWLDVDERLLPIRLAATAGTDRQLTAESPLGERTFDTAFKGPRIEDGRWQAVLSHGDDRVVMWADETLGWAQVFTPQDRASIALEPMSVGPDAFNEGPTREGLPVLQPGEGIEHVWGISR